MRMTTTTAPWTSLTISPWTRASNLDSDHDGIGDFQDRDADGDGFRERRRRISPGSARVGRFRRRRNWRQPSTAMTITMACRTTEIRAWIGRS